MESMADATIITGQFFLDDAIVATKREARDYAVALSPELTIDGTVYRIIIDGNHSFAAALADGVEPVYHEIARADDNAASLLDEGDIDGYLAYHADGDYYDPRTWTLIW